MDGPQLELILNTAELPYTTRHQDYENVGHTNLNFTSRRVPTLQNLSAWNLARNQYLTETRDLMKAASITITDSLQIKDLKTLNNKIKKNITEEEQEEIDHPDLDELEENPRNKSLLKFLRIKVHSKQVENKLQNLSELPKTLSYRVGLAYEALKPEGKANTSLADVLLSVKTAVQWILG